MDLNDKMRSIASKYPGVCWNKNKKRFEARYGRKRLIRSKDPEEAYSTLLDFRKKVSDNRESNIRDFLEQEGACLEIEGVDSRYRVSEKGRIIYLNENSWGVLQIKANSSRRFSTVDGKVFGLYDLCTKYFPNKDYTFLKECLPEPNTPPRPLLKVPKPVNHRLNDSLCKSLEGVVWNRTTKRFMFNKIYGGKRFGCKSKTDPHKVAKYVQDVYKPTIRKIVSETFSRVSLQDEQWKHISGDIFISDHGRMFNTRFNRFVGGRVTKDGYRINAKIDFFHRLVAQNFLKRSKRVEGVRYVVDHIDGNKLNNHVSNLQIISHRLNTIKDTEEFSKGTHNIVLTNSSYKVKIKGYDVKLFSSINDAITYRDSIEMELGDYFCGGIV